MNKQFASYTQSSAFTITLNGNACQILVDMFRWEKGLVRRVYRPWEHGVPIEFRQHSNYLLRRGLIQRVATPNNMNFCLTRPGIFNAQMLLEADFQPTQQRNGSEEHMDSLFPRKPWPPADEDILLIARPWGHDTRDLGNAGKVTPPVSLDDIKAPMSAAVSAGMK